MTSIPIATDDRAYFTALNTALTLTSSNDLLENDWDADGNSLTASIVTNPANGTISSFNGSAGTLTYTPNTSFTGLDSFTYKVNDGALDSKVATVVISVGRVIGGRTNLEELPRGDRQQMTGSLELRQELVPGINLVYQSDTANPKPIVALDTFLTGSVPTNIKAKLTFNGTAGTEYTYSTTGMSAGQSFRIALQSAAPSPVTGRYAYTFRITTPTNVHHDFTGFTEVVNRSTTHAFGQGWHLEGLDQLVSATGGRMLIRSNGDALWFADNGSGGLLPAEGDQTFSTLVQNGDNTFTLTTKHGIKQNFGTTGLLTSVVDRNNNTTSFAYSSGLLSSITDPFGRVTNLTYTSGRLTSVTDFASRTATLSYTSGRLATVTQPDPDGAGSQTSPVTTFGYNTSTHRLTSRLNPLSQTTSYAFGTHGRLTTITYPDANTKQLAATQTKGLPTGSSGNVVATANPTGTIIDERSKTWSFKTNRFGTPSELVDPLSNTSLFAFNTAGQVAKITLADPDGAGSQTSPITNLGYDVSGNLVRQYNPDSSQVIRTYHSTLHELLTETDEVGRKTVYTLDANGNRLTMKEADDANFVWSYQYTSRGQLSQITTPDPDGTAGSLTPAVTQMAYDTYGRLATLTNPDLTTRVFTYNSADQTLTAKDELNNITTFEVDALNRLTKITDSESAQTTFVYDAIGQLTKTTDALGGVTDFEYSNRNWQTKVISPDPDGVAGPLGRLQHTYAYDQAGNPTTETDSRWSGTTVTHAYDNASRRISTTGPVPEATVVYGYDNLGRVRSVEDARDFVTDIEYNSRGWHTKVSQPDAGGGRPVWLWTYNAAGDLLSKADPRTNTTSYYYNSRGRVDWMVEADPDGPNGPLSAPVSDFVYDNVGRLKAIDDALGRTTTYEYNQRDWLTKITKPDPDWSSGPALSPVLEFGYDATGRQTAITDPMGRVSTMAYDKVGRVTSVTGTDPDGPGGPQQSPVSKYQYNALGSLTRVTDPLGNNFDYVYDALQRTLTETSPDPDGAAGPLPSPVTTLVYDSRGLVEKTIDQLNRTTTLGYDAAGRHTSVTDPQGYPVTFGFDLNDNRTSVTTPDPDAGGPLTAATVTYTFDALNRVTKESKPGGADTLFTYDQAGNRLSIQDPSYNNTSWAYDNLNRVTMDSGQRSYFWDAANRITHVTDRNGRVVQGVYDELDRLTAEKWLLNAGTPPTINVTTTNEGGPINEVQRIGLTVTGGVFTGGTFTLTFNGNSTSGIAYDAAASTVQSALEGLASVGAGNVLVSKITGNSAQQEWEITFVNGKGGANVAQTGVDNANVTVSPGATKGKIESTTMQGAAPTDEVQTVELSNATSGTFRLAFEGQTSYPIPFNAAAPAVEAALEDLAAVDNVTVADIATGKWSVAFVGSHSALNVPKMLADATSLSSGSVLRTISYAYNAADQITSASDPDASFTFNYDEMGRRKQEIQTLTGLSSSITLDQGYNANSRRTSLKAQIGSTKDLVNEWTYDNVGRVTQVKQDAQAGGNAVADKLVDFTYNAASQFSTVKRWSDIPGTQTVADTFYAYDANNRLTDLDHKRGSTVIHGYDFAYDNLGRLTTFTSTVDGQTSYSYDSKNQLTGADRTGSSNDESYSYDNNGNRTTANGQNYNTGAGNRLTTDGTYTYEYDGEGNRTKRTKSSDLSYSEYTWDFRNRLTQIKDKTSGGTITKQVDYAYDLFGRLIKKTIDNDGAGSGSPTSEWYVFDGYRDATGTGDKVLMRFNNSGTLVTRYLHGPAVDQILADEDIANLTQPGTARWTLADHQGSVRDIIASDGTILNRVNYNSFGKVISEINSSLGHAFGWTGRERNPESGVQSNRARKYDPAVGRWLSEDPIGFGGGSTNLSSYVGNGPTGGIDPSGLKGIVFNPAEAYSMMPIGMFDSTGAAKAWGQFGAWQLEVVKAAGIEMTAESHGTYKDLNPPLGVMVGVAVLGQGTAGDKALGKAIGEETKARRDSIMGGILQTAQTALEFVPLIGEALDLYQCATGEELITGNEGNRILACASIAVPGSIAAAAKAGDMMRAGIDAQKGTELFRRGSRLNDNGEFIVHNRRGAMQRVLREHAERAGIDLSGINVNIRPRPEGASSGLVFGHAPNRNTITIFRDAFESSEQLVRTILHETAHIRHLRRLEVDRFNLEMVLWSERVARRYEAIMWERVKHLFGGTQ